MPFLWCLGRERRQQQGMLPGMQSSRKLPGTLPQHFSVASPRFDPRMMKLLTWPDGKDELYVLPRAHPRPGEWCLHPSGIGSMPGLERRIVGSHRVSSPGLGDSLRSVSGQEIPQVCRCCSEDKGLWACAIRIGISVRLDWVKCGRRSEDGTENRVLKSKKMRCQRRHYYRLRCLCPVSALGYPRVFPVVR